MMKSEVREKIFCCFCNMQFPSYVPLLKHCVLDKGIIISNDVKEYIVGIADKIESDFESLKQQNSLLVSSLDSLKQELKLNINKERNLIDERNTVYLKEECVENNENDLKFKAFADLSESSSDNEYTELSSTDEKFADKTEEKPHEVQIKYLRKASSMSRNVRKNSKVGILTSKNKKKSSSKKKVQESKTPIKCLKPAESSEKNNEESKEVKLEVQKKNGHTCEICGKEFTYLSGLIPHVQAHNKSFQCKYCSKVFNRIRLLRAHKKEKHGGDSRRVSSNFQCGVCNHFFSTLLSRNYHARKHFPDDTIKCDVCKKVFPSRAKLNIHIKSHFSDISNYECDHCNKIFFAKANLKIHIRSCILKQLFYCSICSKGFKRKDYLSVHMKEHLTGNKKFVCKVCKKSFNHRIALKHHMFKHTQNPHTCLACNEVFPTNKLLSFHKHMIHQKREPLKCDVCGSLYIHKSQLAIHIKKHSNERSFLCSYCGKSFRSKNAVEKHNFQHEEHLEANKANNFQCDYCKQYFPLKQTLERHVLRHTGYKMYVCHICGKSMAHTSNLLRHINVSHLGHRPNMCHFCGKGYTKRCALLNHIEKNH